ncbi:MAG: bifunctional sugar-1-phosphate nucleotidylyltransferase/acetyltransferase [Promethearchaeota archaeon]
MKKSTKNNSENKLNLNSKISKKIDKAVILAAGKGLRLLPITETMPKHLIPLAGKPLLKYIIEGLKNVEISKILIIVGYLKDQIKNYFGTGANFGVTISYKEQNKFLGTAHATKLAKDFVGNSNFFLIYGDLFFDPEIISLAKNAFENTHAHQSNSKELINSNKNDAVKALICLKQVNDPEKFGIIQLDNEGYLQNIIEKPKNRKYGNLANAGIYVFSPEIFDCINETTKSVRGEYELTDSISILKNKGYYIKGLDITNYFWSDIGHPWQIFDANAFLMDKFQSAFKQLISKNKSNKINELYIKGIIEQNTVLKGAVYIGKNTIIKAGTYIEGPVFIGENSIIGPNAYIRPYSSIGNNCKIGNSSELKNTILMDNCFVSHLSYLGDSIICKNVNFGAGSKISNVRLDKKEISMQIKGKKILTSRKKMGAIIGENVQIGINANIMTGIKIGSNCYIGPATIVKEDVPSNTVYFAQQSIIKKQRK